MSEDENDDERGLTVPLLATVDKWVREGRDYDCSLDERVSIVIPRQEIAQAMNLRPGREGEWFNEQGELIAFDPSTRLSGPSTLLIKKDVFLSFLNDAGYDVVWTLQGQKQIVSLY